jgi:hypothetical protein
MEKISWRNEEVLQLVKEERNILKKERKKERKLNRLVAYRAGTAFKHVFELKIK